MLTVNDPDARGRYTYPASFVEFPRDAIEQSVSRRFEQQAHHRPERLAVKFKELSITYSELNCAANRLARTLLTLPVPRPDPVALLVEQGATLITSILAALKLGSSYAPLDRRQPETQLTRTIADLRPSVVLTDERNLRLAATVAAEVCPVINAAAVDPNMAGDNLDLPVSPDTTAYVFYTSGSTGEPKGVVDTHRGVLHNVMRYTNSLGFSCEDRMSLVQHSSFSGTVSTLFGALLNGASVFPWDMEADGLAAIGVWAARERITVFHSVPSIFRHFAANCRPYPELRLIRLEGDSVTNRDVELFQETLADSCALVNGLAATECGLIRQLFIDKHTRMSDTVVPVGYPVMDMDVCVVDDNGKDVPADSIGEIVVKSRYLSAGYWRKPELTDTQFSRASAGRRVYRTGDLGAMGQNGCLTHRGRRDFQAKIAGTSVHLMAVERAIGDMKNVTSALVQTRAGGLGGRQLVAYIVTQPGTSLTVSDIRKYLETRLARHMIPTGYVFLERLPVTPDGKLDRLKLPGPEVARGLLGTEYVAPRTAMEKTLADIWAEALRLDSRQVGVLDSFFDLGGESLSAHYVCSRLEERLGVAVSVVAVFEHRTIRDLVAYLAGSSDRDSLRLSRTSERAARQKSALRRRARRGSR